MSDIKSIESLHKYVELISALTEPLKNTLIEEDILLYRGLSDCNFDLIPSIARYPNKSVGNSLLWFEDTFICEARRKRPDIFIEDDYPVNMLTRLQHYGVPTRLLDITTNALVALYFACQDTNTNGEVIVFKTQKDNVHSYTSPVANAISQSHSLLGSAFDFNDLLLLAETQKYFYMFSNAFRADLNRQEYIDRIIVRFESPLFLFPLELSERQKRQQGAFILFPNIMKKSSNYLSMIDKITPIEKSDQIVAIQIRINANCKTRILKQLQLFGISEDFLFPDSVDTICRSIKTNIEYLYTNSGWD